MFITIRIMHCGVKAAFYSCLCKVHDSRLSSSWVSEQRVQIRTESPDLNEESGSEQRVWTVASRSWSLDAIVRTKSPDLSSLLNLD